ncbi:MAG: hypothetical protein ACYTE8_00895, partial [Planctomycetota bacterium]
MVLTIPKTCSTDVDEGEGDCPFCYDSIHCKAYKRRIDVDAYTSKPSWCKLDSKHYLTEGACKFLWSDKKYYV